MKHSLLHYTVISIVITRVSYYVRETQCCNPCNEREKR